MELRTTQKLFYFFPVLFCFCLPFGSLVLSVIIALWTLTSFFNINRKKCKAGFLHPKLILLYLFFFLTVISALLSSNIKEASFSIEVKLTFFLFPYLLFCFSWPVDILKRCVIAFVSGCFFACIYLVLRALVYTFNGQPEYFFYSLFSNFIHASYFAMYLILAIVCVVVFYHDWFKGEKNILYSSYVFISVFVICIFLCSSKLGLISFFICMPLLVAYHFKANLSAKKILVLFGSLCLLIYISSKIFPGPFERFNSINSASLQHLDKTSSESTTVRLLIWKESIGLIRENFWIGTYVGDANDRLRESYREEGLIGAYEHRFNAHNQFFQTFIGLGIVGFLLLCMITFGTLIRALKRKNFLMALFALLIILNFMVESMLQTAAGVLFFAFFSCFWEIADESLLKGGKVD